MSFKFLDKYLHPETQRKLGFILIAALALSRIWFLAPIFTWFDIEIWGFIDIGTIAGVMAALFLWEIYKMRI